MQKKCITFFDEKKKITLQDFSVIVPLSQTIDEESTDGRYEELEEQINLLNKLIMDKYNELEHIQRKWENQEFELCQHQQQKEKLQQQHDDIKKTHKLEITKINKVLSSNSEELFRLRNHNKTLITKIKN